MNKLKVGILECDHFSLKAIERLKENFEVELYESGRVQEFIEDKDVLFVRLAYEINDELLKKATHLKYLCSPTTGLNHVTTKRKLEIISLKGEQEFLMTIRATPEHTFGLALGLLRNYRYAFRDVENVDWNRDLYRGEEIYTNKVGIIGLGRVGRIIADYYRAFGAKVFYYDILDLEYVPKEIIRKESVEELIKSCNIIHMCASYSDEYRGYFGKQFFDMLENKYFINTARGELINEDDLLEFVRLGKYKGIGLDVLSREAEENSNVNRIIEAAAGKNVIITPHIAGATFSSMMRTEEFIVEKLIKVVNE